MTTETMTTATAPEPTETVYIKGICREGFAGRKVHAAVSIRVKTDELMYRTADGLKETMMYARCLGYNNNGVRAKTFHGFRATDDASLVTCINCRALRGNGEAK